MAALPLFGLLQLLGPNFLAFFSFTLCQGATFFFRTGGVVVGVARALSYEQVMATIQAELAAKRNERRERKPTIARLTVALRNLASVDNDLSRLDKELADLAATMETASKRKATLVDKRAGLDQLVTDLRKAEATGLDETKHLREAANAAAAAAELASK